MTLVGTVGGRTRARVDGRGRISPEDEGWELDWWIGADDRWRMPARETAVRQTLVGDVPVVETAMRVPGGDAIQRVYGAGGPSEVLVVEIANDSPAPFVVAFAVRGVRSVALDGATTQLDGAPALVAPHPPSRWSVGGVTEVEVCSGAARSGPFPARRDRAGRLEAAFLHPVAHRTSLHVALVLARERVGPIDLGVLPTADAAARGWDRQLDRGLRVDLPDPALAGAVRAARAELLLRATRRVPTSDEVAALEDWGFDGEAADAWRRLSGRERRRAARRPDRPATWADVDAARSRDGAALLLAVRGMLAHEGGDGTASVTALAEMPKAWRGQPLEVHDAPTRLGPVSYAVRWHGDRPALLWELPPGTTLRVPGLDPTWSTTEPCGEVLLASAGTAA